MTQTKDKPITERAAVVLQQIEAALVQAEEAAPEPWLLNKDEVENAAGVCIVSSIDLPTSAFIATSRTLTPTSLRMNKTAIEGLLELCRITELGPGMSRVEYGNITRQRALQSLTTLCEQWENR